jgi:periplasmic protein CpxP/Spy
MKKVIFLLAIAITGAFAVQAQGQGGGGFQRRTPEERLKQVKEKLVDLKLNADQTTKSDSTFIEYFRAQSKTRKNAENERRTRRKAEKDLYRGPIQEMEG